MDDTGGEIAYQSLRVFALLRTLPTREVTGEMNAAVFRETEYQ